MTVIKNYARKQGAWVVLCTLAVLVIWGVSAGANGWAGWTLSENQDLWVRWIAAAGSVAVDVLKAGFLFAAASALHQRRWGPALVAVLLFFISAAWAMQSATYFSATMLTQHQADRARDKEVTGQIEENIKSLRERQGFIRQQKTDFDSDNRKARDSMIEERKRLSEEFGILQRQIEAQQNRLRETKVVGFVDPLAAILKLDDSTIVKSRSIYFAILLEVLSALGLWVIAESRIRAVAKEAAAEARPTGFGGAGYGASPKAPTLSVPPPPKGGTPKALPKEEPKAEVAVSGPLETAARSSGGKVVLLPRRAEVDPKATLKVQVSQAVALCLEAGSGDERVLVGIVAQKVNEQLPRHRRLSNPQVRNLLVPAVTGMGASKQKIGGNMWFCGVRLRSVENNQVKLKA